MKTEKASLAKLRDSIESDRRDALTAALDLASGSSSLDDKAYNELEMALTRVDQLDGRLERLSPAIESVREPDIYTAAGPHSFLSDLGAVAAGAGDPKSARAAERLQRHSRHEARLADRRNLRMLDKYGILGGPQARGLSDLTGAGGEFLPPMYLLDEFASVARAASPLSRLATSLPLPADGLTVHVPRISSVSGVVAPMAGQNILPEQVQATTDEIVHPVITFAGETFVSQQLYERGNFDSFAVRDFGESYAASLEQQLVNGTGLDGQMLGLLNVPTSMVDGVPGSIANTWTEASPTSDQLLAQLGQLAADVSDARLRSPSFFLMRGARWSWLSTSPDTNGEPLQRLGTGYLNTDAPDDGPFGPVAGLPVYADQTLPNTLGSGTDQDVVIAARGSDLLLLQDRPRFTAMIGSVTAGQLTTVLQWHTYAAFVADRYPSGIGTLTGTGLTVPSGW